MLGKFATSVIAAAGLLGSFAAATPSTASLLRGRRSVISQRDINCKIRGVNLGGWFVLEPWITPSLFEGAGEGAIDEWTYCQILGKDEARKRLQHHWDTWITQADLQQIAEAGMNYVRIPIGYWSIIPIEGEPFVQGAYTKLGQTLNWAQAVGLNVMIDNKPRAPGSQNGFDNSGRYGAVNWQQGNNVKHTLKVLQKIRDDFADHAAVTAIQLLNEPASWALDMADVTQFYYDGWGDLQNSHVAITIHDAFKSPSYWNEWCQDCWNILVDTHHYEIFDLSLIAYTPDQHFQTACNFESDMRASSHWTISGEWSGAITDCAKWLNGRGKGARYDGTFNGSTRVGSCDGKSVGNVTGLSADDKYNIRRFIEAQLDAYEQKNGWLFWTWKTESAPEWNMKELLAHGLFPQPLTSRQYPNQCCY